MKRKEPRLRDWNRINSKGGVGRCDILKRKEPRLRDWNTGHAHCVGMPSRTWKEKNLDYEIETSKGSAMDSRCVQGLEKKRTSITRLKPRLESRTQDTELLLEKKRTSITRLKLEKSLPSDAWRFPLKRKEPRLRDWNINSSVLPNGPCGVLKRKEPRLRDWNLSI